MKKYDIYVDGMKRSMVCDDCPFSALETVLFQEVMYWERFSQNVEVVLQN